MRGGSWFYHPTGVRVADRIAYLPQARVTGLGFRCARSLGKIGLSALIAALKDEDKEVRGRAANALGQIGPAAKEAVPALIAALKDEDRLVRLHAAWALGQIGPAAIPALEAAARDGVSAAESALKKIRDDG